MGVSTCSAKERIAVLQKCMCAAKPSGSMSGFGASASLTHMSRSSSQPSGYTNVSVCAGVEGGEGLDQAEGLKPPPIEDSILSLIVSTLAGSTHSPPCDTPSACGRSGGGGGGSMQFQDVVVTSCNMFPLFPTSYITWWTDCPYCTYLVPTFQPQLHSETTRQLAAGGASAQSVRETCNVLILQVAGLHSHLFAYCL